ncbi:hypothetical protein EDC94DRAFT_645713 [Helicostylum pulchrum]|nr:hypothetical protein EDC94DRAFT_645713 [Helicostylum pulchrum]
MELTFVCMYRSASSTLSEREAYNVFRKGGHRCRELYVLDESYFDDLIESICNYLSNYQTSIRYLLQEGYEVIGYVQKSPTNDSVDTRTRLLQSMVNNLFERSLVNQVFFSTSCLSYTPFAERDTKEDTDDIIHKLSNVPKVALNILTILTFRDISERIAQDSNLFNPEKPKSKGGRIFDNVTQRAGSGSLITLTVALLILAVWAGVGIIMGAPEIWQNIMQNGGSILHRHSGDNKTNPVITILVEADQTNKPVSSYIQIMNFLKSSIIKEKKSFTTNG